MESREKDCLRKGQPERPGGPQTDEQVEFRGLLVRHRRGDGADHVSARRTPFTSLKLAITPPPQGSLRVSHSGLLEPLGTSTVLNDPGVLDMTN